MRSAIERRCAAFTLAEMMVIIVIIGLLAAAAMPSYVKSMERARWRAAGDVLRTIYAGERVYWTRENEFIGDLAAGDDWSVIFTDDPNINNPLVVVAVGPAAGTGATATFRATATYDGKIRSIDETGRFGGADDWDPY